MIKIICFLSCCLFTSCLSAHNKKNKTNTDTDTALHTRTDHPFDSVIRAFCSDSMLFNASVGFFAVDARSGEVISLYQPDVSLVPASVMKLVTTATALELLGPAHRFSTALEYSGKIDKTKKILNGSIYIRGGGDPALGSGLFTEVNNEPRFMDQWVNAIRKTGIDSIQGCIIADAGIFDTEMIPETWIWGDIGNYFGAGPCGLTIYDNQYSVYLKSGTRQGNPTKILRIEPYIPRLYLINQITSSNEDKDNSYIFGYPFDTLRILKGSIPKGKNEYVIKGSMPDPAYLAAYELYKKLEKAGIRCSCPPTTTREMMIRKIPADTGRINIHTTFSPELKHIVRETNEKSINLFAEHLINMLGEKEYGCGDVVSGAEAIVTFWKDKGISTRGMSVYDGSGLSRFNTLNARQLVGILYYMKTQSRHFGDFYNSLPIAGQTGTLKNLFKDTPAEGNLRAKSGYMTRVRCYAGYLTDSKGREIAFAIMINNFNGSPIAMKKKIEVLLVKLMGY